MVAMVGRAASLVVLLVSPLARSAVHPPVSLPGVSSSRSGGAAFLSPHPPSSSSSSSSPPPPSREPARWGLFSTTTPSAAPTAGQPSSSPSSSPPRRNGALPGQEQKKKSPPYIGGSGRGPQQEGGRISGRSGGGGGGGRGGDSRGQGMLAIQELNRLLQQCQGSRAMLDVICQHIDGLTAANLANGVIRLSRAVTDQHGLPDPRLDLVMGHLQPHLRNYNADQLCAVGHAIGRLRFQPSRPFVSAFSEALLLQEVDSLTPRQATTLIYSLTRWHAFDLSSDGGRVLQALCSLAEARLQDFSPQDLAMAVSGLSRFATLPSFRGPSLDPFLRAFAATVDEDRLARFAPPDVAMTLTGLARVGRGSPAADLSLLGTLHELVLKRHGEYRPWELAMAVEGLQALGVTPDPSLFQAIHKAGRRSPHLPVGGGGGDNTQSSSSPSTTLDASPVNDVFVIASPPPSSSSPPLAYDSHLINRLITALTGDSESLLNFASTNIDIMGPINIATLLNRLSRARIATPADRRRLLQDERMVALLSRVEAVTFDFQPRGLANTLHALAKLGYIASPLFLDQLTEATQQRLDDFKPQELTMAIFGLSKLGRPFRPPAAFLHAVCEALQQRLAAGLLTTRHVALTSSGLARSVGGGNSMYQQQQQGGEDEFNSGFFSGSSSHEEEGECFRPPARLLEGCWEVLLRGLGSSTSMEEWEVDLITKSLCRLGSPPPRACWDAMSRAGYDAILAKLEVTPPPPPHNNVGGGGSSNTRTAGEEVEVPPTTPYTGFAAASAAAATSDDSSVLSWQPAAM